MWTAHNTGRASEQQGSRSGCLAAAATDKIANPMLSTRRYSLKMELDATGIRMLLGAYCKP
jgi:hypothetical protein